MPVSILGPAAPSSIILPFFSFCVPAGFPSPAQDHMEGTISLDELMDIRAPHTYMARADGDSMVDVGIFDRDILIISRGRSAERGEVVIAALDNEPLVKIFDRKDDQVVLRSANRKFPPRYLLESEELQVWGVVSFSIRFHGRY
ncbi:LexA family protein [Stutzerimonas nitrititolerans]|uniref:Ultraviolet light resistance protein A n=1 Tax=Stutzerimonas nitrititolerans TaxID=2482751 RepID=A0ABX9V7W7_9GAMM|nr:translesion error-prone DNA polymerase V autoproteolytic subunit [Stutzerimonas nitrititolerans]KRW65137.1 ultraviolet light resistance protein A [Pseudomonas sp. TTU2014-096BSC]MBT1119012.1 translesion error-prone DNA polymerase V autoproteolytic subunit [Stutzerimonas nitrititolerans]RMI02182.1 ultraviolet light resistance protein A [Stutzerimonas nitrititolerans]